MIDLTPRFPSALGGYDGRGTPILRCDVLVIGGGIAGSAAALDAADRGASVLMLTKNPLAESNTAHAQGGVAAAIGDGDSTDLHLQDTLRVGAGLSDPGLSRQIIAEGPAVLAWLRERGVPFDCGENGELLLLREGGHSAHRIVHHGDATGAAIHRALESALAAHDNINCQTGIFVRDLLQNDGRCVGAVVLDGDRQMAIEAGAVVLTTGGAGQIYRETTNPIGACGDGVALGLRAGATIADIEFVQFHPTTLYIAGASRFLISEIVRGAGAVLRDRDGNRFMATAHPDAELAPRDVVSRAILDQMVETGDTHVYLDLSNLGTDVHASFPTISRICRGFDIDIARDPIPVRPGAHYFIGGLLTDTDGRTDVAGLYAAGEVAATGLHGANRLASNSLLEGAVMGRHAGTAAAEFAISSSATLPKRTLAVPRAEHAPRLHLDDMLYSLKSLMWRNVGLKRDAQGLSEALDRTGLWHHYLMHAEPRTQAGYELANMLTISSLVAAAALCREESRGTHHRVDRPHRNDADWCRRLLVRRTDDGLIDVTPGAPLTPSDQAAA